MVGTGVTARAATDRAGEGRRLPSNLNLLGYNLLRAVQSLRDQYLVLTILRLAGPSTTGELHAHVRRYLPELTENALQRLLTRMRRVGAVDVHVVYPNPAAPVLWAYPGAPRPHDAERRVRKQTVIIERRSGEDRRQSVSWWATADRASFTAAYKQRWHGDN